MKKLTLLLLVVLTTKAGAQSSALAISDSLHAVGKHQRAIEKLESLAPSTEAVQVRLAKAYQAKGRTEEAKKYYRKVLQLNPGRILTAVNYSRLAMQSGNLELADSLLSGLAKKYPKNANFQYRLGLVKEKQKDSSAIDYYYRTVSLDSTHQNALYKISRRAINDERYFTAEKYSKQGLEIYPQNLVFLSLLAQSYYHQHRYEPAAENFQKLIELGEESEFIHSSLGMALYRLDKFEESLTHYQRALQYNDKKPSHHSNLGKLYALTGDLEKSETHLLMAILLRTPVLDSEYLSLALTYKLKRDHERALKFLNRALEENPNNERALFEKAIAADNFYKNLQTKISYYQNYIEKYDNIGDEAMVSFAKSRKSELRKQLHLSQ